MNNIGKRSIFPKSIYILLFSMVIYYWNIFFSNNDIYLKVLFLIGIISSIFSYVVLASKNRYKKVKEAKFNYQKIKLLGYLFCIIGLIAHVIFYIPNIDSILTYGDSYTLGRGNGYITVFFDFYIIGMLLLMESYKRRKRKGHIFIIILLITPYVAFYMFVLMKRRQLILLGIGIIIIMFNEWILNKKKLFYLCIVLVYLIFSVLGKSRGTFDSLGFVGGIKYISENFTFEWISLSNFEGKYMSMILRDVVEYVEYFGLDIKVLLGAITVFIPRKLFGFKYLAFPEWYTYNFHQEMYMIGTGYAGSILAELYLIGHMPFIILLFATLGVLSAKIDQMFFKGYRAVYAICIYILFLLPRLDLGSIVILVIFTLIPTIIVYKLATVSVEDNNEVK